MRFRDSIHDETFRRVVGARRPGALGEPPGPEARAAITASANYRTGAPKGVFRYRSHEEANAQRDAWTRERVRRALGAKDGSPSSP